MKILILVRALLGRLALYPSMEPISIHSTERKVLPSSLEV
jgi:hypothetical protein